MDTPINVFSNWVRSGKDEGMEKNHSSSVENMIEFATKELNNYSFIDAGCGNGFLHDLETGIANSSQPNIRG